MSSLPVVRIAVPSADEDGFLASLGKNVERGGLFLPTPKPYPAGTPVAFEFTLRDLTTVLCVEGTVVLSRPPGGLGRPGMVVRFGALSPEDLMRVERALAMEEGTQDAPLPAAAPTLAPPPRHPTPPPTPGRTPSGAWPRPALPSSPEAKASGQTPPGAWPRPTQPPAPESKAPGLTPPGAWPRPGAPAPADPIVGIDLGGTYCRAGVLLDRGVRLLELEGRSTALPAAVAFNLQGRLLVGTRARANQPVDPRAAVLGAKGLLGLRFDSEKVRALAARVPYELCADEGGAAAVKVRGRVHSGAELVAHLLHEIRQRASDALGRPAERAVISVPASFTERQRQATRTAAHLAGWKVERILADPIAAAAAHCHLRGLSPRNLLVFDLGGSAFDASVVRVTGERLERLGSATDPRLGGVELDARMAKWLEECFAGQHGRPIEDPLTRHRVREAAEAAKIALSAVAETRVHVPWVAARDDGQPIDLDGMVLRSHLETLGADLAQRAAATALTLCRALGLDPRGIAEVILVGGQSLSPMFRAALEAALGKKTFSEVPPAEAVAIGAAVVGWAAGQEGPRRATPPPKAALAQTISLALEGEGLAPLLPAGFAVPSEKVYSVVVGPQGMVRLAFYEGVSSLLVESRYLGALHLRAPAGSPVQLTCSVSREGLLTVDARAGKTGSLARFATAQASDEARAELLASAPLPEEAGGLESVNAKRLLARS